jgi:predicted dithiol-disulfide oxidoreductase (DUF899 family)
MKATNVVNEEEWLKARKELLAKEKVFDKKRDKLTRARQAMPWVKVNKSYVFDSPNGRESLSDLFEERSQLIVYHFMYHPSWGDQPCRSCSFWADNFDGIIVHLNARDVSMVAISKAKLSQLCAYHKRMGWSFKWLSSYDNEFNRDYHVSFTDEEVASENGYFNYRKQRVPREEMPGMSVFAKDHEGNVFHTYSSYARGIDMINGAYHLLDRVPKGRDEGELPWSQAWIQRHDEYGSE